MLAMLHGGAPKGTPRGASFPALGSPGPPAMGRSTSAKADGAPAASYPTLGSAMRGGEPGSGRNPKQKAAFPSLSGLGGGPRSSGGSSGPRGAGPAGESSSTLAPAMPGAPVPGAMAAAHAAEAEAAAGSGGPATAAASEAAASSGKAVDYGLRGLLDVVQKHDRALAEVSLGEDLTKLGLDLKTPSLVATLGIPYADVPTSRAPVADLPASFRVRVPGLREDHLRRMDDSTLFFAFYSMPLDMVQLAATRELYTRGWMLHKKSRVWVREPSAKPDGSIPSGLEIFIPQDWAVKPLDENRKVILAEVMAKDEVDALFAKAVEAFAAADKPGGGAAAAAASRGASKQSS